jgi:hypothetical protein
MLRGRSARKKLKLGDSLLGQDFQALDGYPAFLSESSNLRKEWRFTGIVGQLQRKG